VRLVVRPRALLRARGPLDEPRHRELDELRARRGAPCSILDAVNDSTFRTVPFSAAGCTRAIAARAAS